MSLVSLPPELQYEIFALLDTKTLKSIASTCRSYNDLAAPIIFAEMDIDSDVAYARSVDMLRTLSRDKRWSRRVQRINIVSLGVPPSVQILRWRWNRFLCFIKLLTKALSSLPTLHTVFWRMRDTRDFSMDLADQIVSALASLPALRHLIIDSDTLDDPALYQTCLSRFYNPSLKSARYQGRVIDSTVQCLSSVLSNNPHLTKLDIQYAGPNFHLPGEALRVLSSIVSAEQPSLSELSLSGINIDTTLAARLRHLTSLTTGAADFPPISDVWPVFRQHAIWLKEISIGLAVDQNLLAYLNAYAVSMVEKLVINPGKDTEDLAGAFFQECLPKHAETMKRLSVVPAYEGKWCLDMHNMGVVLQCRKVESLVMGSHLPHRDEWLEPDRYIMHRLSSSPFDAVQLAHCDKSILTDFLQSLVQLRHLRYLRLQSARCLIYRGDLIPGGFRNVPSAFLYHSCLYLQQICERIKWRYDECPHALGELHTDYSVYVVERQGEEYGFRQVEGAKVVSYI